MNKYTHISQYKDEELLKTFLEDESLDALTVIFQRYTGFILSVSMKYLKNKSASEDVVMNVFETFIKKSKTTDIKVLKAWLYTVAKNECLMQLRKNKKLGEVPMQALQTIPAESMESEEEFHLNGNKEQVVEALESLKPEQKKCVELFYFENKSYKEIEQITGYSQNNVKSYIQNGKRNLKIALGSSVVVMLLVVKLIENF